VLRRLRIRRNRGSAYRGQLAAHPIEVCLVVGPTRKTTGESGGGRRKIILLIAAAKVRRHNRAVPGHEEEAQCGRFWLGNVLG
jgi:hypothetical protein